MWRTTTCCFLSRASSSASWRDGHGRPMPERRRPRTRRRPDPHHAIPISPRPAQVPSSARAILRPPARSSAARSLQPPHVQSRGEELPATSLSSAQQTTRPSQPPSRFGMNARPSRRLAAFLASGGADARCDASPLPWLLRRGRQWQAAALARRWRTQMDKRCRGVFCKNEAFSRIPT
ncbi:uncharacterized protein LOC119267825 [Triticum dicoccoides]|uniref:uncharacterized protein LOC119267825 n=1 Tax=Triticum dicoccoides TaxID=85692 RepID=UPI00188DE3CE|nr:uncharacterized protein LOC119267825 [Triticum dicoccoides]XP_044339739.1 uncharacterized protein LOC123060941 [Triticum aestivum]